LTTKIHAVVDALGNPVALSLTPGQAADITQAEPLLAELEPQAVIADKGYDSNALVATLDARGITPVIPPKANRKEPRTTDFALYRERNLVERFFNKLKQYRGIATRFDKLATTFLAGVLLICVVIWLN
jgi:transposase